MMSLNRPLTRQFGYDLVMAVSFLNSILTGKINGDTETVFDKGRFTNSFPCPTVLHRFDPSCNFSF